MNNYLIPPHALYIISSPIGEFPDLDVSLLVASWEDLDIMLKRDTTSGVYGEVSFPIKVCKEGRDLLKRLFRQHQFAAQAVFTISTRSWNPPFVYTHVTSMLLDFTTYSEDDHYVTISGINAELNAYINSFGKNKYDIPVAELVSGEPRWEYQRMKMLNQGTWIPIPDKGLQYVENTNKIARLPIYLNRSQTEMVLGSAEHDMKDQTRGKSLDDYFFKAAEDIDTMTIRLKFIVRTGGLEASQWVLSLNCTSEDGSQRSPVTYIPQTSSRCHVDSTHTFGNIKKGDKLALVVIGPDTPYTSFASMFEDVDSEVSISYYANGPALTGDDAIPVIDPQGLMQKYLDLMAPGKFTCEIEWKDEPHLIRLIAGESLRNYPLTGNADQIAYLHGSPNDFMAFMRVLGYEQSVEGNIQRFKRRDEFFRRDITAATLKENEVAEFKIIANQAHANTKVRIGCEKQDYNSINGRFEGNFVHEYTTGHIDVEDQELDLISPYRTDPIGIELTTWERVNRYTDKRADSDIFAVVLKRDGDKYVEVTDTYIGDSVSSANSIKMFNAALNPYYLVKRNESLIGIISKNLHFTASEGSKTTVIKSGSTTIDPRQDILITKKLHDPVIYNFEVGFLRFLPEVSVLHGLVYVPYRGEKYKGFIQNLRKNHGHETQETWTLWAVME